MTTLLVVDDDPAIRSLVSRWAQAAGYSVTEAASACEALVRVAALVPAVALCDITLPGRDGLSMHNSTSNSPQRR